MQSEKIKLRVYGAISGLAVALCISVAARERTADMAMGGRRFIVAKCDELSSRTGAAAMDNALYRFQGNWFGKLVCAGRFLLFNTGSIRPRIACYRADFNQERF